MNRQRDRVPGQRVHGGVLVVPCLLEGAYRYWFLADTGAAMTMLAPRVAKEIGLDLSKPLRQERIASVHQIGRAPVFCLSSFQLGTRLVTNLEVLVIPLPGELRIDGILGVNFLERFRPTFEFDRSTLVLEPRQGYRDP